MVAMYSFRDIRAARAGGSGACTSAAHIFWNIDVREKVLILSLFSIKFSARLKKDWSNLINFSFFFQISGWRLKKPPVGTHRRYRQTFFLVILCLVNHFTTFWGVVQAECPNLQFNTPPYRWERLRNKCVVVLYRKSWI